MLDFSLTFSRPTYVLIGGDDLPLLRPHLQSKSSRSTRTMPVTRSKRGEPESTSRSCVSEIVTSRQAMTAESVEFLNAAARNGQNLTADPPGCW